MASWRFILSHRLVSAARLDSGERWLAVRAIAGLVIARVAIAAVGFARIRRSLERVTPIGREAGDGFALAVRRAMSRAARTVPGSTCLAQSITAFQLLRRGGHPAVLTIGVARGDRRMEPLLAHAWVRSGGVLVTGDTDDWHGADADEPAAYTALTHIGAP